MLQLECIRVQLSHIIPYFYIVHAEIVPLTAVKVGRSVISIATTKEEEAITLQKLSSFQGNEE